MCYLSFKKDQLINLEYSLAREFLGTNRGGGYCSSTLVFCNTRKYHGLLVVPIEKFRGKNYVMLSSLDETILQHGRDLKALMNRADISILWIFPTKKLLPLLTKWAEYCLKKKS